MEVKNVLEIYDQKRERIQEFNLTNDLFAGMYLRMWGPARNFAVS